MKSVGNADFALLTPMSNGIDDIRQPFWSNFPMAHGLSGACPQISTIAAPEPVNAHGHYFTAWNFFFATGPSPMILSAFT